MAPEPPAVAAAARRTFRGRDECRVALVVPLRGTAGILGPSCELAARLAVEEINAAGGVLGRRLVLVTVDGGQAPAAVAAEVRRLVARGQVDAVTGWHTSAVRQALVPVTVPHVPYVYTALYEGGERAPGVFVTGETPTRQLLPAMRLLVGAHRARRWFVVGNDYVWPHLTARAARRYARQCGAVIHDAVFVPLGCQRFGPVVRRIASAEPDAVLMLLVGDDAVRFNRAFARAGLDARCLRLTTLMDENMLLASGADGTRGLWAASGYFESLTTPESLDFSGRYARHFGADAPALSSLGESCYEGVRLLASLAQRAGALEVAAMCSVADTVAYDGPRGTVRLRANHLDQRVYLAEADVFEFSVVTRL